MAYAGFAAASSSPSTATVADTKRFTRLGADCRIAREHATTDVAWLSGARALIVAGRPRYKNALLTASGAEALALELDKHGADALRELHGGYALAWLDAESRSVMLAIDRLGIGDAYFAHDSAGFAFGTSIAHVRAAHARDHRVSPQAIFDYLYFHVIPAPRTIFEGIERLRPGEFASFRDGKLERGFHWTPTFVENERASFAALKDEFIARIEDGVRHCLQSADGRVGAFLSGGTDSSTIAGLATRVQGAPIDTYSIGFDAAGYDEMEYARIASKHFGTRHHEYYVTPDDVLDAIPRIARIHAQPFGNASAVPTYHCARVAREDGVTTMLAGDGGDELFGGNARYAKQHVFAHYERLPAWMRNACIEPMTALLARGPRLPVLGKAISYVQQAAQPMPARLEAYNGLVRLGPHTVLNERVLDGIDREAPVRSIAQWYFNPSAHSLINRMLAADFKFTLADNDLPKVTNSCRSAGVHATYPMLDDALLDFSLRLPPDYKLRGTTLRWFFKRALAEVLPDAILRKTKHGFGLPFGEWALSHAPLRDLAFANLEALKRRDVVRTDFIDRLTSRLLAEHPGYYGPFLWVLMMLEQWFALHEDGASIHLEPLGIGLA